MHELLATDTDRLRHLDADGGRMPQIRNVFYCKQSFVSLCFNHLRTSASLGRAEGKPAVLLAGLVGNPMPCVS